MRIDLAALNIPTKAQLDAELGDRRATPKHQIPTKVDRMRAKAEADRDDERKLQAWAKAVKNRDRWTDRYTGKPVRSTAILALDSAHAHHVEPRANWDVRHDVRNGLTLSYETHAKVEANELRIVGTAWFEVEGKRYIDCTEPVIFEVVA
jgi:hypothetical protein